MEFKLLQTLRVKLLTPEAKMPARATLDSAGYDLFLTEGAVLPAGATRRFSTGVALALPAGHVGLIRPRSSAFKRGLMINGSLDADYRGEVGVVIHNGSPDPVIIEAGACYGQLIIVAYEACIVFKVDSLDETERGSGGFGSTGNTGA